MLDASITCRYLVDITTEKDRTFRLSLLAGIIGISVPIAHFSSIYIYQAGNIAVWGTALGLFTLALLYMTFFVKDSRGKEARLLQPVKAMPENKTKLANKEIESYNKPKTN